MRILLHSLAVALAFGAASAQEGGEVTLYETYSAKVLRIIDGDTLEVEVAFWPGLTGTYSVRVRGIDAPEVWRPACEVERTNGMAAKAQAEKLYDPGSYVKIEYVVSGSFSGRVIADVRRWRTDRWLSFADEMLQRNLVVKTIGATRETDWCGA